MLAIAPPRTQCLSVLVVAVNWPVDGVAPSTASRNVCRNLCASVELVGMCALHAHSRYQVSKQRRHVSVCKCTIGANWFGKEWARNCIYLLLHTLRSRLARLSRAVAKIQTDWTLWCCACCSLCASTEPCMPCNALQYPLLQWSSLAAKPTCR